MGRLADIFGGFAVFNFGLVWFFVLTLVAGFSTNYTMLIAARAMQGLGPAAFLPTAMMILGKTYRPGPRKNLIFSLCGAFSPLGFFLGVIVGGVIGQYATWRWYFWSGSIAIGLVSLNSLCTVPREKMRQDTAVKMELLGRNHRRASSSTGGVRGHGRCARPEGLGYRLHHHHLRYGDSTAWSFHLRGGLGLVSAFASSEAFRTKAHEDPGRVSGLRLWYFRHLHVLCQLLVSLLSW